MRLPSVVSASLLAPRGLFGREDVVTTIVTTLAEESTSYNVIDGKTEKTVVSRAPSVVEVGAVETTLDIYPLFIHTMAEKTTISVEIEPQALKIGGSKFTGKLNGTPFTEKIPFTTMWTYPGTTLELSLPTRHAELTFSDEISTEITVPPERTHLTINGVEKFIDLPGLTTTLIASNSTSIVIDFPATATSKVIYPETYMFTVHAKPIHWVNDIRYCGDDDTQRLPEHQGPRIGGPCIPGTTFAVTLPSQRNDLFLREDGLATTFTLPGVTTTFVPEETITITDDSSTEIFIIPAEVISHVSTIFGANASSSEESSITEESSTTSESTTEPGSAASSTVIQSVYTSNGSVYTTEVSVQATIPTGAATQPMTSSSREYITAILDPASPLSTVTCHFNSL